MDAVDQAIIDTVNKITHPATGAYRFVYSHQIAMYMPVRLGTRAVRIRLARLVKAGHIYRRPGYYKGYVSRLRAEHEARAAVDRVLAELETVLAKYAGVLDVESVRARVA